MTSVVPSGDWSFLHLWDKWDTAVEEVTTRARKTTEVAAAFFKEKAILDQAAAKVYQQLAGYPLGKVENGAKAQLHPECPPSFFTIFWLPLHTSSNQL